jgi:hypothetical protein
MPVIVLSSRCVFRNVDPLHAIREKIADIEILLQYRLLVADE